MWLMLQQERPDDYLIASGETHSVHEFVELAFDFAGLHPAKYVKVDKNLMRPADVDLLCGDASKAKKELGWSYKMTFEQLVREMVEADLEFYSQGAPRTEAAMAAASN